MKTFAIAAILFVGAASPCLAQGTTVAALVGDDTITMIDAATWKVTGSKKVQGASGKLVGIDVRPADGKLYGVTDDGHIWTIDASGKATMKAKLDTMLPTGAASTIDFNPVADRLRIIGSDGTNLRVNVDDGKAVIDGKLKFAETDMHKGETPKIIAAAYTNSMKGAKETTLYDIDGTIGALLKQAPPNDGVLNAVGKLGVSGAGAWAFDIAAMGGKNEGWLVNGEAVYKVDLETGKASSAGKISGLQGVVKKITVMPAM
jgi:hypothetical protein